MRNMKKGAIETSIRGSNQDLLVPPLACHTFPSSGGDIMDPHRSLCDSVIDWFAFFILD